MEKILKLYKKIDGINYILAEIGIPIVSESGEGLASESPGAMLPSAWNDITITEFEYNASRMGSAPSITAKIKFRKCLDDFWDSSIYAEFDGEKYYVLNTPSSSKDNEDERYTHEIELFSEREILNHVYFIDAVQGDSSVDQQKSNTATVQFFGDINEFASRLNSCFSYLGIGYNAVVDEGITSDAKMVSFEDEYIMSALQTSFETFEIPYYFDGTTVHFGYKKNAISYPMKYGFNEALLSISKENANYAIINKIKGTGSSDNIPYYYPNKSPKGDISIQVPSTNTSLKESDLTIFNAEKFSEVNTTDTFSYEMVESSGLAEVGDAKVMNGMTDSWDGSYLPEGSTMEVVFNGAEGASRRLLLTVDVKEECRLYVNFNPTVTPITNMLKVTASYSYDGWEEGTLVQAGKKEIYVNLYIGVVSAISNVSNRVKVSVSYDTSKSKNLKWTLNGKKVDLEDYGVRLSSSANVSEGDSFSQKIGTLIPSVDKLMPSIYRESLGKEQFYEAKNDTYEDGEGGYYEFENEYSENNQRQGTTEFEDIKPTIVGMTNASGQRMDKFIAFAYDENDSDEVDSDGNYIHPYFFAKLPKYDGENGFNLFDHAIEGENMTISFTSGTCGACSFEVGVGENTGKNIVQVDDSGNIKRDENGNVLWEDQSPQDRQNNTKNYEVWIALKKDDSTYTNIMPNVNMNLKPSTDDTFVITNINLPDAYIYSAEKKLEQALIKYMWENNREKFNFSIKFSRIFFTEHPDILEQLDENSTIVIEYNGKQYSMYVDSFTYKMSSDEPLPEIEVTLVDTISVSQNSLQSQVENITYDILFGQGGSGDFLKQGLKYFLRKDVEDVANGRITFGKGIKTDLIESVNFSGGALGSGFTIKRNSDGKTYAELDNIFVRSKAYFQNVSIMETEFAGMNAVLNSGAKIKVTRVEKIVDTRAYFLDSSTPAFFNDGSEAYFPYFYRCYFNNDDGDTSVENSFRVGDLAKSQSFNIRSGVYDNVSNHYYWRLVIGVGSNYIDLSSVNCDEGSDEPLEGDTVVQEGNINDRMRQNMIVMSAYGDNAPYITFYQGIDSYSTDGKDIFSVGYDSVKDECYLVNYGRAYIGERDKKTYLSCSKEEGLIVKAKKFIFETGEDISDEFESVRTSISAMDGKISLKVGKDELSSAGIDIDSRTVTVTASSFFVNSSENKPIAVFTTDSNGNPLLKTECIDVDNLKVKHLDGADGTFSGELKAATGTFTGGIETNSEGNRIVLDPDTRQMALISSSNNILSRWYFYGTSGYESSAISLANINGESLIIYPFDIRMESGENSFQITPGDIRLKMSDKNITINPLGITIKENEQVFDGYTGTVKIPLDGVYNRILYFKNGILYNVTLES